MYLIVNPAGTRPILQTSFSYICKLDWKKHPNGHKFHVYLIKPGNNGKYDLLLTLVKEQVTGHMYLKGELFNNKDNTYTNAATATSNPFDLLMSGGRSQTTTNVTGPTFNIANLFDDGFAVKGYIPIDGEVPKTIMDDFDQLTKVLDTHFAPKANATE